MPKAKLFVCNLKFELTEKDLRKKFEPHGELKQVKLIIDRETEQSKGFGFIEYFDPDHAHAAIEAHHGTEWLGREMRVMYAKEREN